MCTRHLTIVLAVYLLGSAGCRMAQQVSDDPEFAEMAASLDQSAHFEAGSTQQVPRPETSGLAGAHPVSEYVAYALAHNSMIQVARQELKVREQQITIASSLQDPMVGMTVLPEQIQTAAGQQELALSASQKIPWRGKLDTRAAVAESAASVAQAKLAAVERTTIANVKRVYYELYFTQQSILVTEEEQKLLVEIRGVANARYRAGRTSQQDVLRADLEISRVVSELIRIKQLLVRSQARLARLLHVSPQTKLLAQQQLPVVVVPTDIAPLRQRAVAARPELQAQLAAIQRDSEAVELARLNYWPDVTLGATWMDIASSGLSPVANGRDAVLLTAGINLPIYRNRLDASVRSAQAKAVATARKYDAIRDETLEQVVDLFTRARSQLDLLTLFREDILPKSRQTLKVSSRAYNVGEVDFLQLIDNWRQLLRYELSYQRLQASLRQTLAELERLVGYADIPEVRTRS